MDTRTDGSPHRGPRLGLLAIVFCILFSAGLYQVVAFTPGKGHFPGPWESADVLGAYFRKHPTNVRWCAFLQFGCAIPLGLFSATVVSQLRHLGVRAAGPNIALFGGSMAAINLAASALILSVMATSGIAQDLPTLRALYYLMFAFGGVGYSVPLGLLIAGIAVPAAMQGLLPKWVVISGLALALVGELSWLDMVTSSALPLIPLTRFPAFLWLIAAGFLLPRAAARQVDPNRNPSENSSQTLSGSMASAR
jgi:hypothetical protein